MSPGCCRETAQQAAEHQQQLQQVRAVSPCGTKSPSWPRQQRPSTAASSGNAGACLPAPPPAAAEVLNVHPSTAAAAAAGGCARPGTAQAALGVTHSSYSLHADSAAAAADMLTAQPPAAAAGGDANSQRSTTPFSACSSSATWLQPSRRCSQSNVGQTGQPLQPSLTNELVKALVEDNKALTKRLKAVERSRQQPQAGGGVGADGSGLW